MSTAPAPGESASDQGAPQIFVPRPTRPPLPRNQPALKGGLLRSFQAAAAGVARTVATQRNMKVHVLSGQAVLIVGMALPLDVAARVALLFAVSLVFFAEILNTALEAVVDLFIGSFHRLAMLAKDAAAAGVLVLAAATVSVFATILWHRWALVVDNLEAVQRSVLFGVPFLGLEALGLFAWRRGAKSAVRLVLALGLLAPLVRHSHDPIYAALAVVLAGLAAYARHAFPARTGRGQPGSAPAGQVAHTAPSAPGPTEAKTRVA